MELKRCIERNINKARESRIIEKAGSCSSETREATNIDMELDFILREIGSHW